MAAFGGERAVGGAVEIQARLAQPRPGSDQRRVAWAWTAGVQDLDGVVVDFREAESHGFEVVDEVDALEPEPSTHLASVDPPGKVRALARPVEDRPGDAEPGQRAVGDVQSHRVEVVGDRVVQAAMRPVRDFAKVEDVEAARGPRPQHGHSDIGSADVAAQNLHASSFA